MPGSSRSKLRSGYQNSQIGSSTEPCTGPRRSARLAATSTPRPGRDVWRRRGTAARTVAMVITVPVLASVRPGSRPIFSNTLVIRGSGQRLDRYRILILALSLAGAEDLADRGMIRTRRGVAAHMTTVG